MGPRLGGVAFHRIGKAMMTRKIMIMVMIMMMIMMTMTMTFVGEGRGSFSVLPLVSKPPSDGNGNFTLRSFTLLGFNFKNV